MTKEIRVGSVDHEILVYVTPFLTCFKCHTPLVRINKQGVGHLFICPKCDHKSKKTRRTEREIKQGL